MNIKENERYCADCGKKMKYGAYRAHIINDHKSIPEELQWK